MYGIVARRRALWAPEFLLSARRGLEYRGNDSAGIVVSKHGIIDNADVLARRADLGTDPANLLPVSRRVTQKTALKGPRSRHRGSTCPGY